MILLGAKMNYLTISDIHELDAYIKQIYNAGEVSVKLETTHVEPMRAEIVGIALCAKALEAVYVPVGHVAGLNLELKIVKFHVLVTFLRYMTIKKTFLYTYC